MKACVLALEWSSRTVSVGLQCADHAAEERADFMERFHAPAAMALILRTLTELECPAAEITEIRVGRGPGNFSGIRSAFAWATGLTASGGVRLTAISSGRALMRRLCREESRPFALLGDARRGFWWGAVCDPANPGAGEWQLLSPEEWISKCSGMRVYSAEAERLKGLDQVLQIWPSAVDLLEWSGETEEAAPLYFHPPV